MTLSHVQKNYSSDSAADVIIQAQSDGDAAWVEISARARAGAWLDVIPTSVRHAIRTNKFSLASYLKL